MTAQTVLYGRRSIQEKEEDVYSIEMQVDWADKTCEDEEWPFRRPKIRKVKGKKIGDYIDDGAHSDDLNRPALRRLLEEILEDKKKIKRVVCYSTNRLVRSLKLQIAIIDFLTAHSVTVYFGNLSYAGENAELIRNIISTIEQMFLKELRKNVTAGVHKAIEKGKKVGRPPSGYTISEDGKEWVLTDDGEGVAALLREGRSTEAISRRLGLPITRVARMKRNFSAEEQGRLSDVLQKTSDESRERTDEVKAKRAIEEQSFYMWLIGNTPFKTDRASL